MTEITLQRLKERGSTLVIRCGNSADVVPAVAHAVGASSVYTSEEVCDEELGIEAAVALKLFKMPGKPALRRYWSGTMYGLRELPFRVAASSAGPSQLPNVFSSFRRKVEENCKVGKALPIPVMKPSGPLPADGLPADPAPFPLAGSVVARGANVGEGRLPSLWALGAQDLRPHYAALGVPNPPAQAIGIWESATPPAAETGTLDDSTALSLPSHSDTRGVLPFRGGETAALQRVKDYIWTQDRLRVYKETRNGMLGGDYSSKFSPWLAQGCLSPRTVVAEVAEYEKQRVANDSTYWLLFELIWRDFFRFYALAYGTALFKLWGPRNAPDDSRMWRQDSRLMGSWALGGTGYPFVDANMRELLATGFMSNRGRQNVASFFTKDLDMDWRLGGEWFESLLLDHDPASNYGNWTYVAGVGADPREDRYFLIPKQSRDYDRQGQYMRHWLPELKNVPVDALHDPHNAMPRDVVSGPSARYPNIVMPLLAHRQGKGTHGPRDDRQGGHRHGGRGGGPGGPKGGDRPSTAGPALGSDAAAGGAPRSGGGNGNRGSRYSKGNGVHPNHGRVQHLG